MTNEISALVDGELGAGEEKPLFADLRQEQELRRRCCEYRLIGEAMRGEPGLGRDIAVQVMAAVREELVVLAPQPRRTVVSQHPLWALAATVAGVAVVGWVAFGPQGAIAPRSGQEMVAIKRVPAMQGTQLVQAKPMQPVVPPVPVAQVASVRDVRDYAQAHGERGGALVSVFTEPLAGRRDVPEAGDYALGNVNVHRRIVGDQVLVVTGAVPAASLRLIGDGIVTAQK